MSLLLWFFTAADMDTAKLLQAGQHPANKVLLQLLSDTADACQAALAKATTAAEPQGLIQAYARLQQLQGKPTATPAGAPASMAVTSKVLGLIEGLNAASAAANNPASGGETTVGKPQDKAPASVGKLQDKAGAVAAPVVNKTEQVRMGLSVICRLPNEMLHVHSIGAG